MARKRPKASVDQIEYRARPARTRIVANGLTRAEARALSRSAPLTTAEFRAHRLLANQRIAPLRVVLDGPAVDLDGRAAVDSLDGRAVNSFDDPAVESPEA